MRPLFSLAAGCLAALAQAQEPTPAPTVQAPAPDARLEQLVAPIALYPDALLAQVLMAATYPLEIVEAARWREQNKHLAGAGLEKALQPKSWDPSVKALCGFLSVLDRMNKNLDWTKDLGDAFLADQAKLMDVVQQMRRKALDAGTLKSGKELTVTEREDKIIVIEAADPEVIYVPTYYPTVVYGSWAYPTYYYPPLYAPPPPRYLGFTFLAGVAWGAAVWGDCDWHWGHTEIDIDVDHYHDFVDRTEQGKRATELKNRTQGGKWQHDAQHRQGVAYRDGATAQRYGGADPASRISRDQARGHASGDRSGLGLERPSARPATPPRTTGTRPTQSGSFSGARDTSLDRAASQRGSASRAGGVRGSGGRAGGGRGGGGRGR